ncbi:hypothetical protein [Delftia tsuruhatensis]|jgi:hypothetical protein|uniref:hypothetical protein n=1 Tax=Delftia tsuruhatensis TaxID=180282 RepID=UPI001054D6EC|nr:hypothetical protein [Delftia tsuruhatensis]TDF23837.1 hypothetical protein EZI45_23960 [Delftia tsuruhatensis]
MTHPDLDSLVQRANRQLDGMTINRDQFSRDAIALASELQRWREAHARLEATRHVGKGHPFDDIFRDLFKGQAR